MGRKGDIFFRADGNSAMGLGHITRCIALATMVKEEWNCILLTRCTIPKMLIEAEEAFSKIINLPETSYEQEAVSLAARINPSSIIVLDGYNFSTSYQQVLHDRWIHIVCIDDIHAYSFLASIVINHCGGLIPLDYYAKPSTLFYLGPAFSLLRPPFLKASKERRKQISDNNIFICLGGADPFNDTLKVVQQISLLQKFDYYQVVIGSGYQFENQLRDFINSINLKVSIHCAISAEEMVAVMQSCSYAVCSPSSIVYEYMSVGGIVFVYQIADNQNDMFNFLTKERLAFQLSENDVISSVDMQDSLNKQASLFDGKAGERINRIFSLIKLASGINLRKVVSKDLSLCYKWANDPVVRAQSFNSNEIAITDHEEWFNSKLRDPHCFFYLLELQEEPIAQIRFQVESNEAIVGFLIDSKYRGQGLGSMVLSKGIERFLNDYKNKIQIVGYVKKQNIASHRSFEKLSFRKTITIDNDDSVKYTMNYDGSKIGR
jgi:UDP-2,4-diacetamido-2,4,6-trideoxy-beta-L-altropyranose hydrolase